MSHPKRNRGAPTAGWLGGRPATGKVGQQRLPSDGSPLPGRVQKKAENGTTSRSLMVRKQRSREGLETKAARRQPALGPIKRCAAGTPGVGPPPVNVRPGPAGLRAGNEAHESVRSGLKRCEARKVVYPSNLTCGVLPASRRWRSNGALHAQRGAGGVRPAQRCLPTGSVSRWPAAARACGRIFEPVRASGCERALFPGLWNRGGS